MNLTETTQLLAVIQTYDQRTIGETDVIAWQGTLGDLRFAECRDAVIGYYQEQTDRVMPAHVRSRVTAERVRAAGEERAAEIEARYPRPASELVPMPDWFRATVEEHRRRSQAARKVADDAGEPWSFGDAIVHAFDRQPRGFRPPSDGAKW